MSIVSYALHSPQSRLRRITWALLPPSGASRMFQFNFELEDAVDEDDDVIGIPSNAGAGGGGGVEDPEEEGAEAKEHACFEISLQELVSILTRAEVSHFLIAGCLQRAA
jgi:hypothetical protein